MRRAFLFFQLAANGRKLFCSASFFCLLFYLVDPFVVEIIGDQFL